MNDGTLQLKILKKNFFKRESSSDLLPQTGDLVFFCTFFFLLKIIICIDLIVRDRLDSCVVDVGW